MGNETSKPRTAGSASNNNASSSNRVDNARHVKYNFRPTKMLSTRKSPNNDNNNQSSGQASEQNLKPVKLLVIEARNDHNFYDLFKNCKLLNGREIVVEQTAWKDFSLCYYSDSNFSVCNLRVPRKPIAKSPQLQFRTFVPDYCLVRNVCRGIGQFQMAADHRNNLFGLMLSGMPCINSFQSIYCMMERPLMNAELIKLNKKFGQEQFPIISVTYYPMADEMLITPQYPLVVKVGHGHAGFGKMKLENHKQFMDLKSIVATTDTYCTAERYIEGQCDLRIQKIGSNYQAFRRESVSGNWKTNTGTSYIEEIDLLPRYKFWADECSKCFGGLDICTVDVLVSKADGKEYILEFNGTASGFGDKERDNLVLRDYVLQKLNLHFCPELCAQTADAENLETDENDQKDDNVAVTTVETNEQVVQEKESVPASENGDQESAKNAKSVTSTEPTAVANDDDVDNVNATEAQSTENDVVSAGSDENTNTKDQNDPMQEEK